MRERWEHWRETHKHVKLHIRPFTNSFWFNRYNLSTQVLLTTQLPKSRWENRSKKCSDSLNKTPLIATLSTQQLSCTGNSEWFRDCYFPELRLSSFIQAPRTYLWKLIEQQPDRKIADSTPSFPCAYFSGKKHYSILGKHWLWNSGPKPMFQITANRFLFVYFVFVSDQ